MSKYRVTIDLDFEELPYYIDVVDYLEDLIEDENLNYTVHTNAIEHDYVAQIKEGQKKTLDKG
jgi:hypothetical protein